MPVTGRPEVAPYKASANNSLTNQNSLPAFFFDCARHKEKSYQKRNAVYGALPQAPQVFEKT